LENKPYTKNFPPIFKKDRKKKTPSHKKINPKKNIVEKKYKTRTM
jgi:hypothetical protein